MRIHPWHILSGLGSFSRHEICDFLALFEDTSLLTLAGDRLSGLAARSAGSGSESRFQRRLQETAQRLMKSRSGDAELRLRLWAGMQQALDCEPALPLSLRSASTATAELAHRAARKLGAATEEIEGEVAGQEQSWFERGRDLYGRALRRAGFGETPSFEDVVRAQAARVVADAFQGDRLDEVDRRTVAQEFVRRLDGLPPEVRERVVRHAEELGDRSSVGLLLSAGALLGTGVAVEMAGFGAYVLAAQATAFLPLIGGKAAVSALFVLANPLFIAAAVVGGGWIVKGSVERSVKSRLAAGLCVLAALRGAVEGRHGLAVSIDDFRRISIAEEEDKGAKPYVIRRNQVRRYFGDELPSAAGPPPGHLAEPVLAEQREALEDLLCPSAVERTELAAVAGLTLGEVLYSAASIDPRVVAAVDFSRSEDLADIFAFGAFAARAAEVAGAAGVGAANNIRGYVAEQIVATQLVAKGHDVSLPETSNNAGFDLVVDGLPVQVKCLTDASSLASHFAAYPDIPVIANAECVAQAIELEAPWREHVFAVDGFDYGTAERIQRTSRDFVPPLPPPWRAERRQGPPPVRRRPAMKAAADAVQIVDYPLSETRDLAWRPMHALDLEIVSRRTRYTVSASPRKVPMPPRIYEALYHIIRCTNDGRSGRRASRNWSSLMPSEEEVSDPNDFPVDPVGVSTWPWRRQIQLLGWGAWAAEVQQKPLSALLVIGVAPMPGRPAYRPLAI